MAVCVAVLCKQWHQNYNDVLFCLIADASLIVDNVTKVMEITSADGTTNVWKKVASTGSGIDKVEIIQ